MNSLYCDHFRIQRRRTDEALAACGFDALAIHAGTLHLQFLDDQPYPFKPNPHFKLWIPLQDAADCWIVYAPGKAPRLLFMQPVDYWYKPPALPQGFWTPHFSLEVIREAKDARAHLVGLANCAFVGEWQPHFADWGFAAANPEPLLHRLHFHRATKTAYELECLRRASRLAARGHHVAELAFRSGASEYDIHMNYLRAAGHTENELPYPNIIALNENAAVLHYQNQEREAPQLSRSFLIDAGAQFNGYAADVTRTYALERDNFSNLIDSMHALQQELCSQVRAGVDYASIHVSAHLQIANLLRDAGVITVSGADAVETGLSSVFFPHGIGHLLGLQVHDVAGFSVTAEGKEKSKPDGHPYLRLTRTLEPGYVVTIEPGLYFIDTLLDAARKSAHAEHIDWKQVERLKPYGGIRIEDNVACTQGVPENLTRPAFDAAP